MELQEFVAQALTQIVAGIVDAQKRTAELGGLVNPLIFMEKGPSVGFTSNSMQRRVYVADFDVAVTASDGRETKGGGAITVAAIGFGVQKTSETSTSSISRIRFSVPFAAPHQAGD